MENFTSTPFSNRDSGSAFKSQYHLSEELESLPSALGISAGFTTVPFAGAFLGAYEPH